MDIRIVDRARNVTIVPTKAHASPFAALFELYPFGAASAHTGQVEYECDQAFADALKTEAADGAHGHLDLVLTPPDEIEAVRHALGAFRDIRIVVEREI